jgi:hypothetical protein
MTFVAIVVLGFVVAVSYVIGNGTNGVAMLAAIVFFPAAIAFYLAPSWVAYRFVHRNRVAIYVLNILLGWTALGWIIALVWAYTSAGDAGDSIRSEMHALKACPFCAEDVRVEAIKCKHCGSALDQHEVMDEADVRALVERSQ